MHKMFFLAFLSLKSLNVYREVGAAEVCRAEHKWV